MKKIISFVILLTIALSGYSQVRMRSNQVVADSISFNKTTWVNGLSVDTTLTSPSSKKIITENILFRYVRSHLGNIGASLDTAEIMGIIGNYIDSAGVDITAQYDAVGDTLFTVYNGGYGYTLSFKTQQADTLVSHNTRIKSVKTLVALLTARVVALEANPINEVHITGTPVANQIALFTGSDSTIGANEIYYSISTDNLGVGIAAPTAKIQQDNGNATASYHKFTAGTTTGVTVNDGFNVGIDATGKGIIRQMEARDIGFYVNGSERMTLTNTTGIRLKDDVYLPNLNPVSAVGYLYIDSTTNKMRVDSSYILAKVGLTLTIPKISDLLKSTNKDGEIMWPYPNKNNGVDWIFPEKNTQYGVTLSSHQAVLEILLRKIDELERKNEYFENKLSALEKAKKRRK